MIVNIHKNFFDSILKLSSKDQNRVTSTISQILSDSDNNGLRLHKVGQFWSYSPSMSLRLIAWKKDNTILMLHVDQHDDAYKWAERNSTILNNKGEFIGLVNVSIKQSEEYENPKKSIDVIKLSRLVNIGLTENFSEYLLLLDDFILLEVIESLAPEYQEAILDVITTDSEAQKIINTLPSHIFTVQDDEGLKYALSLPESKWRLFIHPKQKFAVDIPADRNILLRGGPGTGKTVTIIHRFVKLHREQINSTKKPIFLALNSTTQSIINNHLKELNCEPLIDFVIPVSELGKTRSSLADKLNSYSSVLIDEGQDIPIAYVSNLMSLIESNPNSIPPHFIGLDVNQAVNSQSGEAIIRTLGYFDTITLNYSYRTTMQNINASLSLLDTLHQRYVGKDFKHNHKIQSSRDFYTRDYNSPVQGPKVSYSRFSDSLMLSEMIDNTFKEFDSYYSSSYTRAIIIVGKYEDIKTYELSIDQDLSIEIFDPINSKGREFLSGIVIDLSFSLNTQVKNEQLLVSSDYYKQLCGLYVGITRFRDHVKCLYRDPNSPFSFLETANV